MDIPVRIEIIGLKNLACSPFPCDEDRSCGLSDCHPTGQLTAAFAALEAEIRKEFGDKVVLELTLIDDVIPPHIREIIETNYPPLPFVLVNGRYVPMGRISLPLLEKEIGKALSAS